MNNFSALIYLNENVSEYIRSEIFEILSFLDFKGFDYETKEHDNLRSVLTKFPNRSRYSMRVNNDDFVITCSKEYPFITYTFDTDTQNAIVFSVLTDQIVKKLDGVRFAYLDSDSDLPNNIEKTFLDCKIDCLFRINYFGSEYIEKFGKLFFENIPSIRVFFLTNKLIRIDLVDNILNPIDVDLQSEIHKYFSLNNLNIKIFDS